MIRLHPVPAVDHECPHCRIPLRAVGWLIPGMRNLADLSCAQCGRSFYGDLAAGQGLYTPLLLDKETGIVHDPYGVGWFADWMRDSYARRRSTATLPALSVREHRPIDRPVVLLNCLDTLYGHSLLKLLNAQYYLDHRPDYALIVMVPRALAWMVPDGASQVWVVDMPVRQGTQWNEELAREVRRRVEEFGECRLSTALSHPHPDDYDIEQFTRVRPFPIDEWEIRLVRPTVTFIWRDDRVWNAASQSEPSGYIGKIRHRLNSPASPPGEQRRRVTTLAATLREEWPTLDFAVVGLGAGEGDLPGWIIDHRAVDVDTATERRWCERYAQSHLVIGVHGSNMLLPSGHAGAVIDLVTPDRWGNALQDILCRARGERATLFHYRLIPADATPHTVAAVSTSMLRLHRGFEMLMGEEFCRHQAADEPPARWRAPRARL